MSIEQTLTSEEVEDLLLDIEAGYLNQRVDKNMLISLSNERVNWTIELFYPTIVENIIDIIRKVWVAYFLKKYVDSKWFILIEAWSHSIIPEPDLYKASCRGIFTLELFLMKLNDALSRVDWKFNMSINKWRYLELNSDVSEGVREIIQQQQE